MEDNSEWYHADIFSTLPSHQMFWTILPSCAHQGWRGVEQQHRGLKKYFFYRVNQFYRSSSAASREYGKQEADTSPCFLPHSKLWTCQHGRIASVGKLLWINQSRPSLCCRSRVQFTSTTDGTTSKHNLSSRTLHLLWRKHCGNASIAQRAPPPPLPKITPFPKCQTWNPL